MVFGYPMLIAGHRFLRFEILIFSLDICQTLKIVFDHITKHHEVCQKIYSAARGIFNFI